MVLNLDIPETKFLPALMALKECLCTELERAGGPGTCFCGLVPAGAPPLGLLKCDGKACGVAWVSMGNIFPSRSFPNPDEGGVVPCASPLAMSITVGVARCHPAPKRGEAQADEQDYFEATSLYLSDMAAMKRALLCCIKGNDLQISLGTWEPITPSGSTSGGIWTAVIG